MMENPEEEAEIDPTYVAKFLEGIHKHGGRLGSVNLTLPDIKHKKKGLPESITKRYPNQKNETPLHRPVPISKTCNFSYIGQNKLQSNRLDKPFMSASKMTRSTSTPEMDFKFNSFSTIKNPQTYRKMEFSCEPGGNSLFTSQREIKSISKPERVILSQTNSRQLGKLDSKSSHQERFFKEDKLDSKSNQLMQGNEQNYSQQAKTNLKSTPKDSSDPHRMSLKSVQKEPKYFASSQDVTQLMREFTDTTDHQRSNSMQSLIDPKENKPLSSDHNENTIDKYEEENSLKRSQSLRTKNFHNNYVTPIKDEIQDSRNDSPLSALRSKAQIIMVNSKSYLQFRKLGVGGSSIVYQVMDLESMEQKAIKVVRFENNDAAIYESYRNEVQILKKLQYSNRVIKLFDYEENESDLKLVMEIGGVDLANILCNSRKNNKAAPLSEFTIKHYWQEMLLAVQVIHKEGVIHSDLKPANFLLVKGMLKLIDFGIASSIQQDMTSVMKDSQAGTWNYMSPESLNDVYSGKLQDKTIIKIGVKSDVWSLGCILYNMVYCKTPFQHLVKPLQKLATISNPNTKIDFPPLSDKRLLNVLQSCLKFNPRDRPTIEELLSHPFLASSVVLNKDENGFLKPSSIPAVSAKCLSRERFT